MGLGIRRGTDQRSELLSGHGRHIPVQVRVRGRGGGGVVGVGVTVRVRARSQSGVELKLGLTPGLGCGVDRPPRLVEQ